MTLLQAVAAAVSAAGAGALLADAMVGLMRWRRLRDLSMKGLTTMPTDWPGMTEAGPYVWTGGAGIVGRLMFHARQVQQGKRKPLTWALLFDLPIALAMGWIIYGVCVWLRMEPQPTISAAIAASYLGPYSVDRIFTVWAERLSRGEQRSAQG